MINKFDIKDFRIVKHDSVKANFTIVINDCIELFGFRLMYSSNKDVYYIVPPSQKYKEKYFDLVRFSKPVQDTILSDVIDIYNLENKNNITIVD